MDQVGIISRESRKSKESSITTSATLPIVVPADIDYFMEKIQADQWDDFDDLQNSWNATIDARENLLKTDISTFEYLHKFPVLLEQEGHRLVKYLLLRNNSFSKNLILAGQRCN